MKWILLACLIPLAGCGEVDRTGSVSPQIRNVAHVVGVTDGDSLTVVLRGVQTKVRLEGIDAPEKGQDYGSAARKALAGMVAGRSVEIVKTGSERYRRTLVRLSVDGTDVNLAMVRAGMAWHFTRYNNDADLAAAEAEARQARRGLWAQPDPVAPWEWRKEKKAAEGN